MLEEHGIEVPRKEQLTGRDIGRLIRAARNERQGAIRIFMGPSQRLTRRSGTGTRPAFDGSRNGLRLLAVGGIPTLWCTAGSATCWPAGKKAEAELRSGNWWKLTEIAGHCSLRAELAEMAEVAVGDLKICQFMEPHIGARLDGKVLRVSRGGIEVYLPDFNVNGFLPLRTLGIRPKLKGPTLTVQAGKRSLSFTEGFPIAVRITDVDFLKLQVLMELA
ncbi:MAG: S1 RNA-binding domain-containing protein [Planctomycetota bacterium]